MTTSSLSTEYKGIKFLDLFDLEEIQNLQDAFAKATGVASIITDTNGRPITKPSNFCRLCRDIIRKTEKGLQNCMYSDSVLGRVNPEGPIMQPCLSGGLWDGGASILVGDEHIANWLIGQVRNEHQEETKILAYAHEIGADIDEFRIALSEVTSMSTKQFGHVCNALFVMAKQLSTLAYQNVLQQRTIAEIAAIEKALRDSEQSFRQLADSMPQLVWTADRSGNVNYYNQRRNEFNGFYQDSGGNWEWAPVVHPEEREATIKAWRTACRTGVPYEIEHRIQRCDSVYSWFLSRAVPVYNESGEIVRWYGTATDIDTIKKAENALSEAKECAEKANQEKSDFLASVSHEIRTPMTVFMGAIEYILEINENPEIHEALKLADTSSRRLYILLNEILDHSKIEAHQMSLEQDLFSLSDCLSEVNEIMKHKADSKGLLLNFFVRDNVPQKIYADNYRLGQVLLNLIGNAIKFTKTGSVTVTVSAEESYLIFSISDTGIGIPEEKFPYIFDAFKQVDSSPSRSYGGVGLGLAISKGLVELMGGTLRVESILGEGSVFTFTLPLETDSCDI